MQSFPQALREMEKDEAYDLRTSLFPLFLEVIQCSLGSILIDSVFHKIPRIDRDQIERGVQRLCQEQDIQQFS